ncbi:NAD(P)/FAD-dependent oxidoreductase [Glutamicibacter sp. NPDC087344]|uniref:NAD(P)/FAD-dependent oxidoreductase n=1 Tax=Glutamicibacter sp. NPDC087344 TaxID=3363994 RepID=UPI00380CEE6A
MKSVVLVGGGVATTATATGLRNGGFEGEIILVTDETHLPYERPPLSKEYLSGEFGQSDFQINSEDWYTQNNVELVLGTRADKLDTAARTVQLSDGRSLSYDALVLGTGARARTLEGFGGDRIHVLRNFADASRLKGRIIPGLHLVVLGAGFVGCELASVAAKRGAQVTVFHPGSIPLSRGAVPEVGHSMLSIHHENGVKFRVGETVTSMTQTPTGLELSTSDGEKIICDELLLAVGSVPNTEIASDAGIEVDGGIITDEYGRTSAAGVYAVEDVAAQFHPKYARRIRIEHHDTAMRQGMNLARNLLGESVPFSEEHYFWSHQYEHNLQSVGLSEGGQRVMRGSPEGRSFSVFTVDGGQIKAVVTLNRPQDVLQVRKLLNVEHQVTAEQLADEGFALKSLLPQRVRPARSEVKR